MHGTCQGSTQWGAAPTSPDFPKQPSQSPYRQLRKQRSSWGPTSIVAGRDQFGCCPPWSRRCTVWASWQPRAAVAGRPEALLFSTLTGLSPGAHGSPSPHGFSLCGRRVRSQGHSLTRGIRETEAK